MERNKEEAEKLRHINHQLSSLFPKISIMYDGDVTLRNGELVKDTPVSAAYRMYENGRLSDAQIQAIRQTGLQLGETAVELTVESIVTLTPIDKV